MDAVAIHIELIREKYGEEAAAEAAELLAEIISDKNALEY
jgi:hypothetical protein